MTGYTFSQLIDFTRTSAATYVNSAGNIVSTPASVNLLTFTNEFANAAWSKTNATITANSTTAPDGTMTADTLVETAATSGHVVSSSATVTTSAHVFSVYLKKGSGSTAPNWLQLYTGGVSAQYANFNLGTGAVGSVAAGSTATITSVGNGWYRCTLTFTPSSGGSASVAIAFTNNTDTTTRGLSYAGATTSDVLAWGAQLELGSTATTYTRNFGGLFPARFDYDPVTLAPRGLLVEEQRTNLLLRSEEFDNASWTKSRATVTANATTSPDGTADADKLVEDTTATATHRVFQQASKAASSLTRTFSVYLKAAERTFARVTVSDNTEVVNARTDVDLSAGTVTAASVAGGSTISAASASIAPAGNGWYRVSITATFDATITNPGAFVFICNSLSGISYTGDGTSGIFVWGAQWEDGSFATSYIPTTASQVTRAADVATITGANFSQWYNQSEGTFVVEAVSYGFSASPCSMATSDGTSSNRIRLFMGVTSHVYVNTNSILVADIDAGTMTQGVVSKIAAAFKTDDFAVSLNGGAVVSDTSGGVPPGQNQLILGSHGSTSFLNGHIRSIRYYPTRLSNAQLQALSA